MSGLKTQMCKPGVAGVPLWRMNLRVARDSMERRSWALMKIDGS